MTINSYLDKIHNWFVSNNRPVVSLLNKGLSVNDIKILTKDLPIKLTQELTTLYCWRNGTNRVEGYIPWDLEFFPSFHFISLENAMAYYNYFIKDRRWNKKWFPVFTNGAGDFIVVECQEFLTESSPIISFMFGENNDEIEYLSLFKMVQTLSECYTKNAYYSSPCGYIDTKVEQEVEIANKINPGLSRWENELL